MSMLGEWERAVVRAGHCRRDDNGVFAAFRDVFRVVHDGVRHAVDLGRKGIVQKADGSLVHAIALLLLVFRQRRSVIQYIIFRAKMVYYV